MISLLKFRKDQILSEQLALLHQNAIIGAIGYFLCSFIIAIVLDLTQGSEIIWCWFALNAIGSLLLAIQSLVINKAKINPRVNAFTQILVVFFLSITWSFLPLYYLTDLSTALLISTISAGMVSGALTMLAPCLPTYFAFVYPIALSIAIKYFFLGGILYSGLGLAAVIYLFFLTAAAYNQEKMVSEAIKLKFENLDLISSLRDAIAQTEEANRAKSVFLASASHDLRQPLHAQGLLFEALEKHHLPPAQQDILELIISCSEGARNMLDNLLDFSKLEAGIVKSNPTPVKLQPLLAKMEGELATLADTKDIFYRTRETALAVDADIALVELVLRNLISNAIRYTNKGGILVACRKRNNQVFVEVWDTGIGIDKSELKNIFKEYHQLANPERNREKGIGLGLSIVDKLIKTMDVPLTVLSRPGKGSLFRLILPVTDAPIVNDLIAKPAHHLFDGQCIIVIDDDKTILKAMKQLLSTWGCYCLVAETCDEALANLAKHDIVPNLIITDYRLAEGRTGREALAAIQQHFKTTLPAIIITGDTAPDRIREAQSDSAMLLHKPVSATELKLAIGQALEIREHG